MEKKMTVIEKVTIVDESEKIFDKKKAKERTHYMQRNVIPAWKPEKLEKENPAKSYLTKDFKEKIKNEGKLTQYAVEMVMPSYVMEGHYKEKDKKEELTSNLVVKPQELKMKENAKILKENQVNSFGFKIMKRSATTAVIKPVVALQDRKLSARLPPKPPINDSLFKKADPKRPPIVRKPEKQAIKA